MNKFMSVAAVLIAFTGCGVAQDSSEVRVVVTETRVNLLVTAEPKPELLADYLAALSSHIPKVRQEPGNIFIYAHKSEDGSKIVVYEAWESQGAIVQHQQTALSQNFLVGIGPMLQKQPEVDFVGSLTGDDPRKVTATSDTQLYYVIGALMLKPEGIPVFKDNYGTFARLTREDPNNAIFEILESQTIPGKYYAYEVFRDQAAFAAHATSERTADFVSHIGQYLVAPPTPLPTSILATDGISAQCAASAAAQVACTYVGTMNKLAHLTDQSISGPIVQSLSDLFVEGAIFNGAAARYNVDPGKYQLLTGDNLDVLEEGTIDGTANAAITAFLSGYALNTPERFIVKSVVSGTHLSADRVVINYAITVKGVPGWTIDISEHILVGKQSGKIERTDLVTRIEPPAL